MSKKVIPALVKIWVRFVRADHSIEQDGCQGVVTNPEVFISSNEDYKTGITELVSDCIKAGDDLTIYSVGFDNGSEQWQVGPSDVESNRREVEYITTAVDRVIKRAQASVNPDYENIKMYLDVKKIDLSTIAF